MSDPDISSVVFVSFYTVGYEEQAAELARSALQYGLRIEIDRVKSKGNHTLNIRYKPEFILMKAKCRRKGVKAIVWVDADAIFRAFPSLLFDLDCDLAVHYRDGKELLSGTMYWSFSDRTMDALEAWVKQLGLHRGKFEQVMLQEMLEKDNLGLKIEELPTEYCKIFDLVERQDQGREVFPVIEHFQRSRARKEFAKALREDFRR
ncbi:MAG TPA: hypothetical protein ENI27_06570 [bacterium]|nr:hypothetical protein [bacterium]